MTAAEKDRIQRLARYYLRSYEASRMGEFIKGMSGRNPHLIETDIRTIFEQEYVAMQKRGEFGDRKVAVQDHIDGMRELQS